MITKNILRSGDSALPLATAIGPSTSWNRDALLLLSLVFALNVYRAVTQSLTTDEAFTYNNFVSQRLGGLLATYDANNHVLNSLLARLSVTMFGLSEFTLRLPSVLAGGWYLFAARRLCVRMFGSGPRAFLVTALLCTNPFLLDHLSAARGYGMALAFLISGAGYLVRNRLYPAAVFCGLAIAANLTSVFPVAAMAIAYAVTADWNLEAFWEQFAVPATLVSFVLVIFPLSKAAAGNFYFGANSLRDTLRSLRDVSFPFALHSAVLPATLLLLMGSAGTLALRRKDSFFPATLLACVALVFCAHQLGGVPYPLTRTALYFVPLATLSAACVLQGPLRWPGATIGTVCLLAFVMQARTEYYAEWRFDAGTKRIVNFIRARSGDAPLTIRASWPLEPTLNFYRARYGLHWAAVDRGPLDRAGDFWILIPDDRNWVERLHLRPVWTDEVSGQILASEPSH